MTKRQLKPVVKWAGGKSQLITEISKRYPAEFGITIKKYAEPFVGGGAVLFDVLQHFNLDDVYISDVNVELINMYRKIKDDVDGVIKLLGMFQSDYLPMPENERKVFYYARRDEFNCLIKNNETSDNLKAAALFIFLNRTCFNGLYRVNRSGLFNVPSGGYKVPLICDEDNLRAVSAALQNVNIVCADYHMSGTFIDSSTLVYFDPPYRPLNITSGFTSYTADEFDDEDQAELASYAKTLSEKGAFVMLSNSDPKNVNSKDDFFDVLYNDFHIDRIEAARMINSNPSARGKISELLIYNY